MSAQAVETPPSESPHQHLQLFHTDTPPQIDLTASAEVEDQQQEEDPNQERLF